MKLWRPPKSFAFISCATRFSRDEVASRRSGRQLGQALAKLGYRLTRQKGSHMRLTTEQMGQHHVAVQGHNPMRIGTLHAVLKDIANHHHLSMDELLRRLEL